MLRSMLQNMFQPTLKTDLLCAGLHSCSIPSKEAILDCFLLLRWAVISYHIFNHIVSYGMIIILLKIYIYTLMWIKQHPIHAMYICVCVCLCLYVCIYYIILYNLWQWYAYHWEYGTIHVLYNAIAPNSGVPRWPIQYTVQPMHSHWPTHHGLMRFQNLLELLR